MRGHMHAHPREAHITRRAWRCEKGPPPPPPGCPPQPQPRPTMHQPPFSKFSCPFLCSCFVMSCMSSSCSRHHRWKNACSMYRNCRSGFFCCGGRGTSRAHNGWPQRARGESRTLGTSGGLHGGVISPRGTPSPALDSTAASAAIAPQVQGRSCPRSHMAH